MCALAGGLGRGGGILVVILTFIHAFLLRLDVNELFKVKLEEKQKQ